MDVVPVFKRGLQILTDKGIPIPRKGSLLITEKVFPGEDAMLPEMLLSLWSNARNMDKGVLKQLSFLFSLSHTGQAIKVTERFAMTWIDIFYGKG